MKFKSFNLKIKNVFGRIGLIILGSIVFFAESTVYAQTIPNQDYQTQNLDHVAPVGQVVFGNGYGMTNAPFGDWNWWHVMSMRHGNGGNNFTTQLSGEFFGNRLAFRNTQNSNNMPWNEIFHSGNLPTLKNSLNLKLSDVVANDPALTANVSFFGNQKGLTWENVGDVGRLYYTNNANGDGKVVMEIGDDLLPEQGFLVRGMRYDGLALPVAYFQSSGNVGIGTMVPNEKLAVNGKIRAQEIKVEAANWPDYVFEENYEVGSLKALDSYIKVHKHLPEIPSAKDVERDGVALGQLNKLLLKKIEELTLHLIEKDKKIEDQGKQLSEIVEILRANKLYTKP